MAAVATESCSEIAEAWFQEPRQQQTPCLKVSFLVSSQEAAADISFLQNHISNRAYLEGTCSTNEETRFQPEPAHGMSTDPHLVPSTAANSSRGQKVRTSARRAASLVNKTVSEHPLGKVSDCQGRTQVECTAAAKEQADQQSADFAQARSLRPDNTTAAAAPRKR